MTLKISFRANGTHSWDREPPIARVTNNLLSAMQQVNLPTWRIDEMQALSGASMSCLSVCLVRADNTEQLPYPSFDATYKSWMESENQRDQDTPA